MIRTKLITTILLAATATGLIWGNAVFASSTDKGDLTEETIVTSPPGSDGPQTPTTVRLNKRDAVVVAKKKLPLLQAYVYPPETKVKWTSSDNSVATVTSNGIVSGLKAGYAVITVTSEDGVSDFCNVTVLYKDVMDSKDFWYEPTYQLTSTGVVKGYNNQTEFRPANNCSRAQMVTFIWRLAGEPKPKSATCKFTDVTSDKYYYKPVIWAVENGITTGYNDNTFRPNVTCLRRHAVTFLWRFAGSPKPSTGEIRFKDVKETDYFCNPVIWASEQNILAGYEDGTFKPEGECLRRQMVTFLYKYDKFAGDK